MSIMKLLEVIRYKMKLENPITDMVYIRCDPESTYCDVFIIER